MKNHDFSWRFLFTTTKNLGYAQVLKAVGKSYIINPVILYGNNRESTMKSMHIVVLNLLKKWFYMQHDYKIWNSAST